MHGEKNDRGGAIKAPPPMGLGLTLLNRAGLFWLSQVWGGGGGPDSAPPPRISAAERQQIVKFGTYVELVHKNVLKKFQYVKSMRF